MVYKSFWWHDGVMISSSAPYLAGDAMEARYKCHQLRIINIQHASKRVMLLKIYIKLS
jgi:hypothetical protein